MAKRPDPVSGRTTVEPAALPTGLLPCFRCGYDLRGGPPSGDCPECGQAYRREQMYVDVARQKLREFKDEVLFVLYGGCVLDACAVLLWLAIRAGRLPGAWVVAPFLVLMGALLILLYLHCWARLLYEIHGCRTLLWGQVRGLGLLRELLLAGLALAFPPTLMLTMPW